MQDKTVDYDVIIIGAGVAGCSLARELSRYKARIAVLEAGNDVAFATSRANSGIVHAGYDPEPGSLKAHYNVIGARLFNQWAAELEFAYIQTGSLVLAFSDEEVLTLKDLQRKAEANGVEVELLNAAQVHEKEAHISNRVQAALYAPHAGICDPYGLTFASAEHAAENGVDFYFCNQVSELRQLTHEEASSEHTLQAERGASSHAARFLVSTVEGNEYTCSCLVNAAGVFADEINNQLSANELSITPVRGEYMLYDTQYGSMFSHVLFQAPGPLGKGALITPTAHGNLIIGPNAIPQESKTEVSTTSEGLENILLHAQKTWPEASLTGVITNYAGLRAHGSSGDFVIGEASDVPGFYNIACFESPGLTAAPAVAIDIATQVANSLELAPNENFSPRRKRSGHKLFAQMSNEERREAIAHCPEQGQIVCRCCNVSLADILFEFESVLPILSLDTFKWRAGAMMGRCHGGFCAPEIMEIIYERLGTAPEKLNKRLAPSPFVVQSSASYREEGLECSCHEADYESAPLAGSGSNLDANTRPEGAQKLYDVIVVGAGAAGMAAAVAASAEGARVALLDREDFLGGILRQCIHNGFGLTRYKKELTGPEYAQLQANELLESKVELYLNTTALSINSNSNNADANLPNSSSTADSLHPNSNSDATDSSPLHTLIASSAEGLIELNTKAIILATGSREKGQGTLNMAGSRPSGVFSAGSAQNLINLKGCMPGRKVVIQGSGDIGLIMARRCYYSGAEVLGVLARSSEPSGLRRNVRQCLDDYGIPFFGNSLVTRLEGEGRLEAVWVSKVDPATKQVINGSEERWACDTLLLSVGLVPENELALTAGVALDARSNGVITDAWQHTNIEGVFACGNAVLIHDLADYASEEGERAGRAGARFALGKELDDDADKKTKKALTSSSEQKLDPPAPLIPDAGQQTLLLTCVRCPKSCDITVTLNKSGMAELITGEGCKRGIDFVNEEITAPTRTITASLAVKGSREPISVRTTQPVLRELVFSVLEEAYQLELCAPIEDGTLLLESIAGTEAGLIATKSIRKCTEQ